MTRAQAESASTAGRPDPRVKTFQVDNRWDQAPQNGPDGSTCWLRASRQTQECGHGVFKVSRRRNRPRLLAASFQPG